MATVLWRWNIWLCRLVNSNFTVKRQTTCMLLKLGVFFSSSDSPISVHPHELLLHEKTRHGPCRLLSSRICHRWIFDSEWFKSLLSRNNKNDSSSWLYEGSDGGEWKDSQASLEPAECRRRLGNHLLQNDGVSRTPQNKRRTSANLRIEKGRSSFALAVSTHGRGCGSVENFHNRSLYPGRSFSLERTLFSFRKVIVQKSSSSTA